MQDTPDQAVDTHPPPSIHPASQQSSQRSDPIISNKDKKNLKFYEYKKLYMKGS